jgi:hypothetical protein
MMAGVNDVNDISVLNGVGERKLDLLNETIEVSQVFVWSFLYLTLTKET